jgi:MFS transporter, ACS family, hexuronate transporter
MRTNFFILLCAQIFVCFAGLVIPPLIPFIQSELKLTYTQLGSIMTFLYLGAMIMSFPAGWLTDKLGVKKMIFFAQVFTGFSVALYSITENYLMAIVFAIFIGLGYGMINPPTTKGILLLVSKKYRGLAMSVKQTGVPIGGAVAAGLLPPIAILYSWKHSLLFGAILIIFSGLLSHILYHQNQEGVTSITGNTESTRVNWREIYQNKNIIFLSIGSAFCCMVQLALVTYIILYLKDVKKFSLITAAFYLTMINIGGILGRISWGIISDRLFKGARKIVLEIIVSLIFVVSLILGINIDLPPVVLSFILFIFGFSAIGWNGIYHAFIGELSGEKLAGRAVGLSLGIAFLGNLSGPVLYGKIIDITGTYNIAWFSLCVVMIGAFISFDMIQEKKVVDLAVRVS